MNSCRRCTIIFDAQPVEIGRSAIDPTLCILCESEATTMQTNTHEKKIKVHTLVIDDTEVLYYKNHTDEWIDVLSDLLVSKPPDDGDKPATKRAPKKSKRVYSAKVPCPFCSRLVSPRQMTNHQRKCPSQPMPASDILATPDGVRVGF